MNQTETKITAAKPTFSPRKTVTVPYLDGVFDA